MRCTNAISRIIFFVSCILIDNAGCPLYILQSNMMVEKLTSNSSNDTIFFVTYDVSWRCSYEIEIDMEG